MNAVLRYQNHQVANVNKPSTKRLQDVSTNQAAAGASFVMYPEIYRAGISLLSVLINVSPIVACCRGKFTSKPR